MKHFLTITLILILLSCGKEKSVLLPEIENTEITEILDVSPAYLFYDETKPDSLELNRGNLIVTTNWLVNVDKRLTLKQVIPSIMMLQEKKRNSGYKNKSARNYYTCNATSIKNLGFIDFTDVVYDFENKEADLLNTCFVAVDNFDKILIYFFGGEVYETNISSFENKLKTLLANNTNDELVIKLSFNETLSFQDYIGFKSLLSQINLDNITIVNDEFIFNHS